MIFVFEITKNNINLIVDDAKVGYILYDEKENYLVGSHIYIIPEEREKGYSCLLIERFADLSKGKSKKIIPTCPVIKRYLESNYQNITR